MMHHHTKFGDKMFGSSEDTIRTITLLTFWSFAVILTLNAATTLAYGDVPSNQVWLQTIRSLIWNRVDCQRSEKKKSKTHKRLKERFLIRRNKTKRANFHHISPGWYLDREDSESFFSRMTLRLIMMHHHTIRSSEDIVKKTHHILIISALAVTLTLKTANQYFGMTLQLMIIHHHTKFGYKRLSGSRDTVRIKSGHTNRRTNGHTDRRTL